MSTTSVHHRRPRPRGVHLLCVALAAVLLTACGDDDDTSSSDPTSASDDTTAATGAEDVDTTESESAESSGEGACQYVTTEQAGELAGSPVKPGVSRSLPSGPVTFEYCDFMFDPGNSPGVTVAVVDLEGQGEALFEQLRQSETSQSDFQAVEGVGDEAFFAGTNLNVRHGDTGLILFVGRANGSPRGPDAIPDEKRLAQLIIDQL
ncbi:MAG: hypothetical protein Q8K58_10455 [Acidimicrobiales bacterium]|nr:hypothetical protein [Acidimicrobiales bacterium]